MSWENTRNDGSESKQTRLSSFTGRQEVTYISERVLSPRAKRLLVAVVASIGLFHLISTGDFYTAVATGIGTSVLFEMFGVADLVEKVSE